MHALDGSRRMSNRELIHSELTDSTVDRTELAGGYVLVARWIAAFGSVHVAHKAKSIGRGWSVPIMPLILSSPDSGSCST